MSQTPPKSFKKVIHNIFSEMATVREKKPQDADLNSNDSKLSPSDSTETFSKLGVNRRRFVQGIGTTLGATTLAGASLTLTGCGSDEESSLIDPSMTQVVSFNHGVASGDPLKDRVILWTRVTPETTSSIKVTVNWSIASDEQMNNKVAQGQATTSAKNDYTVKVDASGLEPNTVYYYQFSVAEQYSRIGKTKTLPIGNVDKVKLAVFSCANYPAGYFHVYANAAKRGDVDACVHLGDYIYEYGRTTQTTEGLEVPAYASSNAAQLKREVMPPEELITINEYRRRYAQYHTDPDLQELHANLPMIAVWDDHELANDSYVSGAENHQSQTEGSWDDRKLAAVTAYHEWMPTRNSVPSEIYRRFDFGNLVSLHMLDTRIVGREEQLNYLDFIKSNDLGEPYLDADSFMSATNNPERQMLGLKQSNWLVSQLQSSTATWQILGQQVLMARMLMPAPVILNIANPAAGTSIGVYLGLANKARTNPQALTPLEQAILAQPYVPYNLDAWDGYGSSREMLLTATNSLNKNLVVLSGDTHNAWASNITNKLGDSVGVEFATSSVTSPGFEEYLPTIPASILQSVLTQLIQDLQYMNANQRGYMLITATAEACESEWIFVSDILLPTYSSEVGNKLRVLAGENKLSS